MATTALAPTLQSTMAEQDGLEPPNPKRPPPPSRKGKGPSPSSWKPGQSGNPKGRPRTGLAFAERVRERVDPDLVIDIALELAADESVPTERRLAALLPLIDRGFIKPPTTIDATVTATTTPRRDLSQLSLEERRELLARIRAVPELASGGETQG